MLGPYNSGKSTLVGHLYAHYELPDPEKSLAKAMMHVGYYTSDKKRCYSYFLDSYKEFDRNRTDHIHHKKINIEHRLYHFMDAPGERSMIPNTIMGIA